MNTILRSIEEPFLKTGLPEFRSGDTVRVHVRVVEGNRERTQVFEGVVIRFRNGGINKNFTVRRVTNGVGVERTFLLHSPRVERVEVVRFGKVRRANLYYLRGRTGKAARIKERRYIPRQTAAAAAAAAAPAPVAAAAPVAETEPAAAGETDAETPTGDTPREG